MLLLASEQGKKKKEERSVFSIPMLIFLNLMYSYPGII